MITELNYQSIINLTGLIIAVSLPIGLMFGIATKLVNMMVSMVFGEKTIKL